MDSILRYRAGSREKRVSVSAAGHPEVRVRVEDDGERRTVTVTAREPIELISYREVGQECFKVSRTARYFFNGYQSWTDTRERMAWEVERNVKRLPKKLGEQYAFDRYGDAAFYEYDHWWLHGYDVFYVTGGGKGMVINLNYRNAYLVAQVRRSNGTITLHSDVSGVRLAAGESFTLCDYLYYRQTGEGMEAFKRLFPKRETKKIFGYTSWYNYYQNISESILTRDLAALDGRFNLFQIDDGYETFVGDWLDVDEKKFPRGLAPLVNEIHGRGFMAGLWLAPFVAEEKSRLFREKPDWFRKGAGGKPIKCGSNWSGFYALDLDRQEVRDYIVNCLRHYVEMGFDFFKLDFLYAANVPEYPGRTRSQVAEDAYGLLREALGHQLILGCGATLMNAAGRFDYLRVGPDVSLKFDDVWYMRLLHRERISTKVTLQNTVYRSFMDGRLFGNDPDVFLLRDDNISLTPDQRKALITLNALFGSVLMTSDNIADYDEAKRAALTEALALFEEAEVTEYHRQGRRIIVRYSLRGETRTLTYDTEKGVLL